MRSLLTSLALLSLFIYGSAFAHLAPGPATGYVNDFAGLLSQEEKTTLETTLSEFHTQYGGEIVVATVASLSGHSVEFFANELFREWGIGEKNVNNGVLFLVAKEEREMRIEVGYGYEGVLTDARSSEIIRNTITPYFKQGLYGLGIMSGVRDIITTITTGEVPLSAKDTTPSFASLGGVDFQAMAVVLFLVVPWLASMFGRSKSWWAGGVAGGIVGFLFSYFIFVAIWPFATLGFFLVGLLFDFIVSRGYKNSVSQGTTPPWWTGGGFGGFGGGSSGGGGASGRW